MRCGSGPCARVDYGRDCGSKLQFVFLCSCRRGTCGIQMRTGCKLHCWLLHQPLLLCTQRVNDRLIWVESSRQWWAKKLAVLFWQQLFGSSKGQAKVPNCAGCDSALPTSATCTAQLQEGHEELRPPFSEPPCVGLCASYSVTPPLQRCHSSALCTTVGARSKAALRTRSAATGRALGVGWQTAVGGEAAEREPTYTHHAAVLAAGVLTGR